MAAERYEALDEDAMAAARAAFSPHTERGSGRDKQIRAAVAEYLRVADPCNGAIGPLLDLIRRAHDDPHGSLPISWYEQAKEVLDHHAGGQ